MKTRGFTLIEILVTTALFAMVTGGGIASYVQFNQREKLKAAALKVETYLRKAQTYSLAGVKNEVECGDLVFDGWCLDVSRSYLYGHCGGPVAGGDYVDFDREDFSLPAGVTVSFDPPAPGGGILLFKPLTQGVDNDLTICLSSSGFGVTYHYRLSVTTAGEITDEGFVTSCP